MTVTTAPDVDCDWNTLLYSVSANDFYNTQYYVYGPMITVQPTFDPSSPAATVGMTYPERPRLTLDANGQPENLEAATGYAATVTATAPDGYTFVEPTESTRNWSFAPNPDAGKRLCYQAAGSL